MISLPKIDDPRGNLSFIEHGPHGACPFVPGTVAWIYDLSAGESWNCGSKPVRRMVVAMSGSFEAVAAAGDTSSGEWLSRSDRAVVVEPNFDLTLRDFSTNAVALIIEEAI